MQVSSGQESRERERVNFPIYRVNFWEPRPAGWGWPLDAWILTECLDVREVLNWVEENARGRRFEVFVAPYRAGVKDEDMTTLVRLLGENPNDPNPPTPQSERINAPEVTDHTERTIGWRA